MSSIELHQVTKRFDTMVAVNAVDLTVEAGEVVCLLGPSGCGKTTTLRMVAGLEQATSGDILLDARRVNELRPAQRDIAMVFQFYALYPSLTVAENLAFPLHGRDLDAAAIERRVQEVALRLDLTEVMQRTPGQLAEGEKQRVAVGRAIVRDPSCFLFDEPLSRLDLEVRQSMRTKIKEVLADLSKPTVIVTHDQIEALTMADRIAVMRGGAIEQVATPDGIFNDPANTFVAGFIGTPSMNLLPARFGGSEGKEAGGEAFSIGGEVFIPPSLPEAARLASGEECTLGFRPRALELASEAATDTLSAEVELIEPMGAETLLHLRHVTGDMRVVVPRKGAPSEGDVLHVRPQPGQTLLFTQDGERIRP